MTEPQAIGAILQDIPCVCDIAKSSPHTYAAHMQAETEAPTLSLPTPPAGRYVGEEVKIWIRNGIAEATVVLSPLYNNPRNRNVVCEIDSGQRFIRRYEEVWDAE